MRVVDVGRPVPRSDAALVAAVRSGDSGAFAALYRAHVGAVRRVASEQVRSADSVADVVQDTFVRALQHLTSLRDPERFRPWLLAIARHTATDALRTSRRVTALDDERAKTLAAGDLSPDSLAELRELARQVEGCVTGLSRRDATALAMVTELGFTPAQVAGALGLTQGAAKVVVHRARRRLRDALVLQLMARDPSLACGEFRALLDADSPAASRHLRECNACIGAAGTEVIPFSALQAQPTTSL